jgi:hypothetical protein
MLRNSIVEQRGRRFTMLTGPDSSTAVEAPDPGAWVWFSAGAVMATPTSKRVELLGRRIERDPVGHWPFKVTGLYVTTLSYPGLTLLRTVPADPPKGFSWDGSVTVDDGWVYLSGFDPLGWRHVIARTRALSDPWELWTGTGWSYDSTQARPLDIEQPPLGALWSERIGARWVASGLGLDATTTEVLAWEAPAITGPYRSLGAVAQTGRTGWFAYAGRVTVLPEVGAVVMWSCSADPATTRDETIYGPHFAPAPARVTT